MYRLVQNRAEDSDIVATSTIMSLKCPLSTLRMSVPCRSILCTHNQCFDAASFIQLQEQAPTWTCPVCSKSTSFESLQVDEYVDDILQSTPSDVDQVVIEPDGQWFSPRQNNSGPGTGGVPSVMDDDDELVEVGHGSVSAGKPTKQTAKTIPSQSAGSSTVAPAFESTKKRPASQVIDLTGSDEDDSGDTKKHNLSVPENDGRELRGFALWQHTMATGGQLVWPEAERWTRNYYASRGS